MVSLVHKSNKSSGFEEEEEEEEEVRVCIFSYDFLWIKMLEFRQFSHAHDEGTSR